ncbi:MAG: FliA/WhiG family RNA polymerase sigma factor [Fibromonadaceae bacterium]|jgi:RNA polymerase sigma factor for flagellar operon FliA|nr:FliA/WhiG family RNA polymerase sigma factor [Fibromonadaceae bacterium]
MDMDSLWTDYKEHGSTSARDKLLAEYTPIVRYTAQRMAVNLPKDVQLGDLIGAGVMGLIKALESFDSTRDVKFETYATHKIRGAILDDLREQDWVPRSIRQKAKTVKNAYVELEKELGRTPYDSEVAEHLDLKPVEFEELLSEIAPTSIVSLNEVIFNNYGETMNMSFIDTIEDENAENPLDRLGMEDTKRILANALMELPENERHVIALYHYEELTLKEIGIAMNLTESRVSQIHSKAMTKLKAKLQLKM